MSHVLIRGQNAGFPHIDMTSVTSTAPKKPMYPLLTGSRKTRMFFYVENEPTGTGKQLAPGSPSVTFNVVPCGSCPMVET